MPFFSWAACPDETRSQVARLVQCITALLDKNLVGVYLHGSLCLGCFNPKQSDLDLIAISSRTLALSTKKALLEALLMVSQQPHPIEISLLTQAQLHPWRHPAPYALHYSESWRARIMQAQSSGDWQTWMSDDQVDRGLGHR